MPTPSCYPVGGGARPADGAAAAAQAGRRRQGRRDRRLVSLSHDLICFTYNVYGAKYIDLVSLAPPPPGLVARIKRMKEDHTQDHITVR